MFVQIWRHVEITALCRLGCILWEILCLCSVVFINELVLYMGHNYRTLGFYCTVFKIYQQYLVDSAVISDKKQFSVLWAQFSVELSAFLFNTCTKMRMRVCACVPV